MPDQPNEGETPEQEVEEQQAEQAETGSDVELGPDGEPFDPERAMATIEKLRGFEKQAKALEKQVAKFEKAEEERRKAEMTEMERLQAERDEFQAELNRLRINETKRAIAKKVGLPEAFALRIQGDDEDAMKQDAENMLEALPKQEEAEGKTKKVIHPTNPSFKGKGTETDNERRKRLGLAR